MTDDGALTLFQRPGRGGRPRKLSIANQYRESLRSAYHLRNEDRALMEVGRRLAEELDDADDAKSAGAIAGQLIAVLDRLGLSPQARVRLGLDRAGDQEVNPLDELALIRGARRGDTGP